MNKESLNRLLVWGQAQLKKAKPARVAALLSVLGVIILWACLREPRYDGLSLTEWLHLVGSGDMSEHEIAQVIHEAGPEEIPRYLKMLKAQDSPARNKWIQKINNAPFLEIDPFTAKEQRDAAAAALRTLGPKADQAFPDLLEMLNSEALVYHIAHTLPRIRRLKWKVLKRMWNQSDEYIRVIALDTARDQAFDDILDGKPPSLDIPDDVLIKALQDPSRYVRGRAILPALFVIDKNPDIRALLESMTRNNLNHEESVVRHAEAVLSRADFKRYALNRLNGPLSREVRSLFTVDQQTRMIQAVESHKPWSYLLFLPTANKADGTLHDPSTPWTLACMKPHAQIHILKSAFAHSDTETRRNGIGAVWFSSIVCDIPVRVDAILNILHEQDPQVRRIAIHTLRHAVHTNESARTAVSLRLKDEDANVRKSAQEILGGREGSPLE